MANKYELVINDETLEFEIKKNGETLPFESCKNIEWGMQSILAVIIRTESEVKRRERLCMD